MSAADSDAEVVPPPRTNIEIDLERIAGAMERTADALERFALNDNERMETNRKLNAMVEDALPAMAAMLKRFSDESGL